MVSPVPAEYVSNGDATRAAGMHALGDLMELIERCDHRWHRSIARACASSGTCVCAVVVRGHLDRAGCACMGTLRMFSPLPASRVIVTVSFVPIATVVQSLGGSLRG